MDRYRDDAYGLRGEMLLIHCKASLSPEKALYKYNLLLLLNVTYYTIFSFYIHIL